MSSEQRTIILENDDSSITYVGNWTTVQASTVSGFGNFGSALSSTLRSTSNIGSFVFPFSGSSITVFGSVNIANFSTNPNPTWKCSVDGISLGAPNLFQFPENNWSLCNTGSIPDGSHQLVVNVTADGMPFYLDYIQYHASANVSLENSLIRIENTDPEIDYISGWGNLGSTANQTTNPKGLVNVTFIGIQLSWYGLVPTEENHNASSGEYSIDGGPFAPFDLKGLAADDTASGFNQLFFLTPTLEMGPHVLSAKYTGSSGETPFTLDYLIVANGSFPSSASGGGTNGTGTHSSNPTKSSGGSSKAAKKSSSNVGGIVGGVVGAVVGVAVVAILFFIWYRKRRQGPKSSSGSRASIMPFYTQDQDRMLPSLPPSSPPASAPSSTDISKSRIQHVPQQQSMTSINALLSQASSSNLNNTNNNNTSLYTIDASHSHPGGVAGSPPGISSLRTSVRRPLPPAPAPTLGPVITGKDVVQHADSGIRLGGPNEIPPSYTEL